MRQKNSAERILRFKLSYKKNTPIESVRAFVLFDNIML
jgi:hypothetical protein